MKRLTTFAVGFALCGSAAMAGELNITVEACGSNSVAVAPGCEFTYNVIGVLGDANNEGLALVGFDLELTDAGGASAGAMPPADSPTWLPMRNFVIPDGITNPEGFGGTQITGKLVQSGGGQNTINNTYDPVDNPDNAEFPRGLVITGVAQPAACTEDSDCPNNTSVCRGGTCWQVLVTGKATAPAAPGEYKIELSDGFANLIQAGEDGTPFWRTEAATIGAGNMTSLALTVDGGAPCVPCACSIVSSYPPNGAIDARQTSEPDGSSPDGWRGVRLTFDCSPLAAVALADLALTELGADGVAPGIDSILPVEGQPDTVEIVLTEALEPGTWMQFAHTASGTSTCLGYLPGNVNSDSTASPAIDLSALIDCLNSPGTCDDWQENINRDSAVNVADLTRLIDLFNGAASYISWTGASLAPSPCN